MTPNLSVITSDDPRNNLHDPSRTHDCVSMHEDKAWLLSRALSMLLNAEHKFELTELDWAAVRELADEIAHHTSVVRFLRTEAEKVECKGEVKNVR